MKDTTNNHTPTPHLGMPQPPHSAARRGASRDGRDNNESLRHPGKLRSVVASWYFDYGVRLAMIDGVFIYF